MFHITYLQAVVSGVIQGITELFPVSSLGHSVLIPAWLGGSWRAYSQTNTYLLVAIALHLASALALLLIFSRRWIAILKPVLTWRREEIGFKIFMLLLLGTLPVALIGTIFNNFFQSNFEKPLSAAIFLTINGLILVMAELLTAQRNSHIAALAEDEAIVARVSPGQALVVGVGQSFALFAGISRFGITISFGMLRGLTRSIAADFAFLLSFPVIFGASFVKLPKLLNGSISGSYGQVFVGFAVAFVMTILSVKVLVRWFETRSLKPFAIYSLIFGVISIVKFGF